MQPDEAPAWLADAIAGGGGEVVPLAEAEGLVWAQPDQPDQLVELLAAHPHITWVQLPWAGVEPYRAVLDAGHTWTSGKGVYAEPVAEHVLALLLAGLRNLVGYSRTTQWGAPAGINLFDARITVVGGGGISEVLLALLAPFRARVTVVRRRPASMDGAAGVVGAGQLGDALAEADAVVLALALLPETVGLIGAAELALMKPTAWLVNVARGAHVVTDDLVVALRERRIGGAALDVTDPEPLPEGHPLWSLPNCLITPHTANTPEMAQPLLAGRVAENIRRRSTGQPLLGVVDPALGY